MTNLTYADLLRIQDTLFTRLRNYSRDLQVLTDVDSVACVFGSSTKSVTFVRPSSAAQTVEALMGRDMPSRRVDLRRHPVLEVRTFASGIVVELILSSHAWWDQQNLTAKLSVSTHRDTFYKLISQLDARYVFGFWEGTHLDDMHLTAGQLRSSAAFNQWMATFADGRDWLRIGMWIESESLDADLTAEVFNRLQELVELYRFVAWTSNNDFRSFQQRKQSVSYA